MSHPSFCRKFMPFWFNVHREQCTVHFKDGTSATGNPKIGKFVGKADPGSTPIICITHAGIVAGTLDDVDRVELVPPPQSDAPLWVHPLFFDDSPASSVQGRGVYAVPEIQDEISEAVSNWSDVFTVDTNGKPWRVVKHNKGFELRNI